jgi:hypothetical protein
MRPKSNADFNPGDDDVGQRAKEEDAERDNSIARRIKDVEESVRGNRGLSQARDDRAYEDSETEEALKRSTQEHDQNRP